jgi:OOP family OmpA-OmpF porin
MKAQMDTLASVLKANPGIKVKLTGNTDQVEVERASMRPELADLDKERAESVKAYLVEAGVGADRISVAGNKGNQPAVEEGDEISMSQNRRVEVDVAP